MWQAELIKVSNLWKGDENPPNPWSVLPTYEQIEDCEENI